MAFNPDYRPTGTNNASNPYYQKVNHVRISKSASTKHEFIVEAALLTSNGDVFLDADGNIIIPAGA